MAFNLDDIINKKLESANPQLVEDTRKKKKCKKKKKLPQTEYTKEQLKKILAKYDEVPRAGWGHIPSNTYIRYKSALDGKLKPGGRLVGTESQGSGYTFKITKYGRKRMTWNVHTDQISNVYKINDVHNYDINPPQSKSSKGQQNNLKNDVSGVNNAGNVGNANNSINTVSGGGGGVNNSVQFKSPEVQIMDQLGDKLLFSDNDLLTKRIDAIEARCERMETEIHKLFNMLKVIYTRQSR